jgi:hypothetical protein
LSWGRSEGKRLTANLVESVRVDDKPRKRHIASLASIREREIDDVRYRCHFWDQITRKLNHLRERVSAGDRRDIEGLLAERVPCPTRKQYDQWKNDALQRWGRGGSSPLLRTGRVDAFSAEPEAAPRSRRGGEAAAPRRNAARG